MLELIKEIKKFAKDRDWDKFHSPKNLAMALSVEVSEIIELFQWLTEDESYKLDNEKLKHVEHEVADVLVYLLRLSDKLGVDPVRAAKEKIEINKKRYPVDKVRGSSKKYNEY